MPKESSIQITYTDFDSAKELAYDIQSVLATAKEYANNAYAPYSNFKVGAAVLLSDGSVVGGNNQENRAFPSGLCAERVAVFAASSSHPNKEIKKVAVYSDGNDLISPCGSCRQALLEYEEKQGQSIELYLINSGNRVRKFNSISELLPFAFKFNNFKGEIGEE